MDSVTLSQSEYQDLIDARDHAIAMREVGAGAATIGEQDMDAFLAAATPLAFWRRHRGMTQAALSQLVGVSQPSLAQAETGRRGLSVKTWAKLARALGVRMEDVVVD